MVETKYAAENTVPKGQCKYCKQNYCCKCSSGTGHRKQHMETCEPKHVEGAEGEQTQLFQGTSSGCSLGVFSYNPQVNLSEHDQREEEPDTWYAEDNAKYGEQQPIEWMQV